MVDPARTAVGPTAGPPGPRRELSARIEGWLGDQAAIRARIRIPARPGLRARWPDWLLPEISEAYVRLGIQGPWGHQARAAELAWAGAHVIIGTGTASGKSAAFGMPALNAALMSSSAPGRRGPTVLYVAPTKALAHDQCSGLRKLGLPGLRVATLDGDTSREERGWARAHARWILTNPDMLHHVLLAQHDRWRSFLRELRFIVVDEAHSYRGVFGAHTALVLRRLNRLAEHHGASPTFIAASATIAEPAVAAGRLLGVRAEVVTGDDSAHGPVELLLCDPSFSKTSNGRESKHQEPRVSAPGAAATLMRGLVESGVTTLTFTRSRRSAENIARTVQRSEPIAALVRAYRGGYLPEERRALEAGLREGTLRGVASTNALELGIDISGLGAVIMAGWPGTRASFWQQAGRAGRAGDSAVVVLLADEDPLDHYVVNHSEVLTDQPVEATVLDPENPYVVAGHLCAAAAEAFLQDVEVQRWFGAGALAICSALTERGMLRRRRNGWFWTRPDPPWELIDLRGTGGGPVRIVEGGTGRVLGTVDQPNAPRTVHPGAIYVHQGDTHEVLDLDLDSRVATVRTFATELSTQALSATDVQIEEVAAKEAWGRVTVRLGQVRVTDRVSAYLLRRWPDGDVMGEFTVDLPPTVLATRGMWWVIPDDVLQAAGLSAGDVPGALHALEHAAIGLLPLLVTCDRWDLGGASTSLHPQTGAATIFIHDAHPGGAGFAERGYRHARPLLQATAVALRDCRCQAGCPRCVQSPKCGSGNEPLDKAGALSLADAVIEQAEAGRTLGSPQPIRG